MQVWVVSYGTKSRSWFLENPLARIVANAHPDRSWTWDVGRTVKPPEHAGSIPLFWFDMTNPDFNPEGITIHGLLGKLMFTRSIAVLVVCKAHNRMVNKCHRMPAYHSPLTQHGVVTIGGVLR